MKKIKKFFKILKRVKLSTLIMLIILFSFGTYSWFLFATKVSTGLTAHVTAWKFKFTVDDQESEKQIYIDLKTIQPGMQDYVKTVKVTNTGEIDGELEYQIKRIEALGRIYETSDTVTSDDLLNIMKNDFPFKLDVTVDNSTGNVIPVNGSKDVTIKVTWPLDSQNDELDSYWGMQAYEFYKQHPNENSVRIDLILKVKQPTK